MPYCVRHPDEGVFVSDDPALLDVDAVHAFLTTSYWSPGIPRETVARAIANSLCFGLYEAEPDAAGRLIGFARVVTDRATFGYLADVFLLESHRGRGFGVWLVQSLLTHPDLQGLRRLCLMTRDAHALYARLGFEPMRDPSRYMQIHRPDVYAAPR